MTTYQVGDTIRLTYAFRTGSPLALADPDKVTFKINPPNNEYSWLFAGGGDPEVVRDSLGNFHIDWQISAYGVHNVTWQAFDSSNESLELTRDEFYAE